eukprot:TRINITY_DN111_c0_g1_i1.p1 TRINITY_DN111_c0_g1~~TRINITY_DN111_c0_g1_i1.p1  ORF type:complete len:249 (-),score=92.88 TRINITY_DN111_c0_g1_i1:148-894(-)
MCIRDRYQRRVRAFFTMSDSDSEPEVKPVKDSKKRKSLDSEEKNTKKAKKDTPKKEKEVETPKDKKTKEETPKKKGKEETPKKKEAETPKKKEAETKKEKTPTKKNSKKQDDDMEVVSSSETKYALNAICKPLAPPALSKKCLKLTQKAASSKQIRRGVKEVVKALRKNERGLCLLAGDISPIEVICHIPIICEEAGLPYIYVPSKAELGVAAATKRPTSVVLISDKTSEINSEISSLAKEIKQVPAV